MRPWRDFAGAGHGDLRGVIGRLDHLSWPGADAILLPPTMPSADAGWGYDVSDCTGVHAELGASADLDELIAGATCTAPGRLRAPARVGRAVGLPGRLAGAGGEILRPADPAAGGG